MRRYDDPVEVKLGEIGSPEQFLWHGRLWQVKSVVARWIETAPWWRSTKVAAVIGTDGDAGVSNGDGQLLVAELLGERELWRVEAGRGRDHDGNELRGVFDLCFTCDDGRWQLVGCAD